MGDGLGMKDGLVEGTGVVGASVGLGLGIRVGSAESGVGSKVVGSLVGLGVGIVEGI